MRIKRAMAIIAMGLCGLTGTAWSAGVDAAASAACVECHDAEDMPDMSRSAHAVTTDPRTPTCVTCHGPSPGHVKKEAGKGQAKPDRMFTKAASTPVAERNAACLTCHQKDAKRALWGGSQHETADLACSSCHKVPHQPGQSAQPDHPGGSLHHLPQGATHPDGQAFAPPGARRQDELFRLPQRAWIGRSEAGQARQHQRHLLHLPRRKARTFRARRTSR